LITKNLERKRKNLKENSQWYRKIQLKKLTPQLVTEALKVLKAIKLMKVVKELKE
jgi:hypothetical protein